MNITNTQYITREGGNRRTNNLDLLELNEIKREGKVVKKQKRNTHCDPQVGGSKARSGYNDI